MNQVEVRRRQLQAVGDLLGVASLVVLGRITGVEGVTYFAVCWEILAIVLIVTADMVPDALARLIRSRKVKGKNRSALRIGGFVSLYQAFVGIVCGVLLFAFAQVLASGLFHQPYAVLGLRLLAPVVFFRCLSAAFLGKLKGQGMEMPTVAVSLLRPLFVLGLGLLFGNIMKGYGVKVSALLQNPHFTAMYGVTGFCLGILISEVLVFLFLLLMMAVTTGSRRILEEGGRITEGFGGTIGSLYRLESYRLGQGVLLRMPFATGLLLAPGLLAGTWEFGSYYGRYLVVCGLSFLWGNFLLMPISGYIQASVRKEEISRGRVHFGTAIHLGAVYSLFAFCFISFGASQINGALFTGNGDLGEKMLRSGGIAVVFAVMGFVFMKVLQGFGRQGLVAVALGVGCLGFVCCGGICLPVLHMGGMGLVLSLGVGSFLCCALAAFFAMQLLVPDVDLMRMLVFPLVLSVAVGLVTLFLGRLLTPMLGSLYSCLICFLTDFVLYWLGLLLCRSFRDEEWRRFPGGRLMETVARLLKVN
jgi:stage V sporulation protein B